MGDLVGKPLQNNLYYFNLKEIDKVLSTKINSLRKTELLSIIHRINILYMVANAGSGHIGSSFSSIDIMTWWHLNNLNNNSIFFSSKGHDAPALYSNLLTFKSIPFNKIHKLRRLNGLPGHPDIKIPGIITNTGSLGMGISKAKGLALANRLNNKRVDIFVLLGDGELQEGQIWESLHSLVNLNLSEITIIVDHNKLQSDTLVSKTSDLGNLKKKFQSFGLHVSEIDGHNFKEIKESLENKIRVIPKVIIAHTIKGKGVSFMEHTSYDSDTELYKFHSGAPSEDQYKNGLQELLTNLKDKLSSQNITLNLSKTPKKIVQINYKKEFRLIDIYSDYLVEVSKKIKKIICLDADLALDTGLLAFKKTYPNRFIECGIAEQDMVSIAGALALKKFLPIVHSFSCFLTSRPNEQIYNNSTENTKIIYVGSLSGLIPAGPGHSHQALRDICTMKAIPNLIIAEPSDERTLKSILDIFINQYKYSSYLRLNSLPFQDNNKKNIKLKIGHGIIEEKGSNIKIITYGPIMIKIAKKINEMLFKELKTKATIVNFPWLNIIDKRWIKKNIFDNDKIVIIDNHYADGGLGDTFARSIVNNNLKSEVQFFNVKHVPPSGANQEVLENMQLDASSIFKKIKKRIHA